MPEDDMMCGVIDCDGLDTDCRDYHDLQVKRCASLGTCKAANTTTACTDVTVTCQPDAGGTGGTGGVTGGGTDGATDDSGTGCAGAPQDGRRRLRLRCGRGARRRLGGSAGRAVRRGILRRRAAAGPAALSGGSGGRAKLVA